MPSSLTVVSLFGRQHKAKLELARLQETLTKIKSEKPSFELSKFELSTFEENKKVQTQFYELEIANVQSEIDQLQAELDSANQLVYAHNLEYQKAIEEYNKKVNELRVAYNQILLMYNENRFDYINCGKGFEMPKIGNKIESVPRLEWTAFDTIRETTF